jgi:uridine kinase
MVAQVVLLAGASGSGKTSLTRRVGLPTLALDDFYRDADDPRQDPPLPRRFGIVDWDDPASWDAAAALAAVRALCRVGAADVPVYDIPTSRRTGTVRVDLGGRRVFVAEGIFAAELVTAVRERGLLADALCLTLHPAVTFGRRLLRDLAEMRKPPLTLVRRGLALARAERGLVERWTALGCRPCSPAEAERWLRELAAALR